MPAASTVSELDVSLVPQVRRPQPLFATTTLMSRTTVYRAHKIITMDPMQREATHVAVREGRVLAVGSLERMREWGDFDLDERFTDKVLMPGFVEGHSHLKEGGMWQQPYLGWFDRRGPDGRLWPGLRS